MNVVLLVHMFVDFDVRAQQEIDFSQEEALILIMDHFFLPEVTISS